MAAGESYGGITVPEGDPGALEASAGRLVATAGMLESISGSLRGVLGQLSWFGPAGAAHSGLTSSQSLMATTGAGSLIQKAAVINDYALVLEAAQRQAERAIERARDADRRIKEAKADIRQAVDDQAAANLRILAAQAAQSRAFSSVLDLTLGNAAAVAAADAAAAEEADARRDLQAAEERERRARQRLEEAEDDRREAQKDGDDAEEAVALARTGLIAAAQGAGLLPTQPGGPADPVFAAAAGIRLEPPKPPPEEDDRNWLERRVDDVGNAASWTWDQAKQVPGGVWEGTKGLGEGAYFLYQLNPSNPMNWRDPGAMIDRYEQLGETGKYAWDNPGEFGKTLINYEDLEAGRYGEWLGNLGPDAVVAVATGGAGAVVTRGTRVVKATDKLSDAASAYNRASDMQNRMPTQAYRDDKTFAAQPGDKGGISISGEKFTEQERMLERIGEDPDLLKRQDSAEMRERMLDTAGHRTPGHGLDIPPRPEGWYNGTHAELRLLVDEPKVPVGVTRNPCLENCDPGIQRLAASVKEDIVVQAPDGPTLYRADGEIIRDPSPKDFTGVNSRWPGALWGAAGGGAAAAAPSP